jgi:glycine cleavage system T protein (aminomethyltransferase)
LRSGLYERHLALGAKMVDFAGWEMPLHYSEGSLEERNIVRERVGLFDVSHMGRIVIEGPQAEECLDAISANRIADRPVGSVTYTVWCHKHGGTVDDLLVYRTGQESFFVVANAANRQKDLHHLLAHAKGYDLHISDRFQGEGILAVQGPRAWDLATHLFPRLQPMKPMHVVEIDEILLASSGYTGERGFELMASSATICDLWDQMVEQGERLGVAPVGLAARDLLRLEMGYALYGHELSDEIAPTESVSAWTVRLDKSTFIGREALLELEESGKKRSQVGLRLLEPGVARADYPLYSGDQEIGVITSGNYCPALQASIAIAMVTSPLSCGEEVSVKIRNHYARALVVPFPFITKESTHLL